MLIFSVIGPSAASLPAGRFRPAGRNPSARRRPVRPALAGLVLALAVCALPAAAGPAAAGASGDAAERPDARYYLRLKNEEFLRLMIPKEKALLVQSRNIFEEAKARRDQGRDLSALDLESVTSSRQLFLDAYAGEVGRVLSLFDEIAKLESTARRRANLSALEILAGLRRKVRDILERAASGSAAVTATAPADPGAETASVNAPPEPDAASAGSETALPQSAGSGTANPEMAETLLDQWKYNSLLEFKLRQTRTELIRTKLLKTATQEEADRMFRRDLREALQAYAAGDFVLSRLLLRDVIETYPGVPVMDDVLYYAAEASFALNYLDEALQTGERLAGRYPLSPYTAKALVKKLFIEYATGRADSLQETYDRLLAVRNRLEDEPFGVASYVAGLAAFNRGSFGDALSALARVPDGTAYAFPARYLSAACHSNLNNDDSAMAVYYRLASGPANPERDPVLRRIRNNARLKLGLIYYERGENRRAITLFNQVDDDFQKDDLTLLARAWSAYRSGRPVEALANTETLLTQTLFSGYQYEAQVLAARSKELLGQSDEALRDMERVRRVRLQPAAPLPAASADSTENARNRTLFAEANRISRFLSEVPAGPADDPAPGGGDSRLDAAADALGRKIGVLDSLEARAQDRRNWMTLDRIRKLRGGAIQALQTRNRKSADRLGDQDPLIRRMGMSVYLRYLFDTLLSDVLEEKRVTAESIAGIDRLSVRSGDPMSIRIRMEIRRDELEDYGLRLNQYEVWLRENRPQPFAVEIDRWANFSEYGISNINFNRIREIDGRMTEISSMIRQIDEVHRAKREELSQRVAALLRDVEQIERQMKADLRKKDEQERDRFFQTDYFDTRRRETPVDAPVPERPRFEAEVLP